jgi:hypothetical protein
MLYELGIRLLGIRHGLGINEMKMGRHYGLASCSQGTG